MAANDSYRRIWEQALLIPPGQVASYGQIAHLAGLPRRAARIVGRALHAAPQELNVPWHRVVNAQGGISLPVGSRGYKNQIERLTAEGVVILNGKLSLDKHGWDPSLDELLWGPGRLEGADVSEAQITEVKVHSDG
jgi:methylated-DNA-protein-cysteine methyltransferase-like protein